VCMVLHCLVMLCLVCLVCGVLGVLGIETRCLLANIGVFSVFSFGECFVCLGAWCA